MLHYFFFTVIHTSFIIFTTDQLPHVIVLLFFASYFHYENAIAHLMTSFKYCRGDYKYSVYACILTFGIYMDSSGHPSGTCFCPVCHVAKLLHQKRESSLFTMAISKSNVYRGKTIQQSVIPIYFYNIITLLASINMKREGKALKCPGRDLILQARGFRIH